MVEITEISDEEFDEIKEEKVAKGQWKKLCMQALEDGKPRKVEGLTRGQVAALYRRAQEEGLEVETNYGEGSVAISPAKEEE